jgi:hypothetical protein
MLANAEDIDDVMLVVANVMFDDILKSPAVTLDMPKQAVLNIFAAGEPDIPLASRNPVGKFVTLDMLRQAELNIFPAGAPVSPNVFMKLSGKFFTPVML